MARAADKLLILLDASQGLLARLYSMIQFPKPALLDENMDRFCKHLIKKFPLYPEDCHKVSGWEIFQKKAIELVPQLRDYYLTLVEVADFKLTAWEVLEDISKNFLDFHFDSNQDMMIRFLDLVVAFVQIHLLVERIPDRKLLMTVYARAYHCVEINPEPNFPRVATFINDYEAPLRKLQEECNSIGMRVADALMSLQLVFHKWSNPVALRESGVFNLLDSLDNPTKITQHEIMQTELMYFDRMKLWIMYGFLVCPAELQREGSLELLRVALSDCLVVPIYRELNLDIHTVYRDLYGYYKSGKFQLSKHKDPIKDGVNHAVEEAGRTHMTIRNLLRWYMNQMLNIFRESPGLIAPKIQMVYAALSLARSEVVWYFHHHATIHRPEYQPPKHKSQWAPETWHDDNISELIYLIDSLITLATQYSTLVREYYQDFVSSVDVVQLRPLLDALMREPKMTNTPRQLVTELFDALASLSTASASDSFLDAFRLSWYRAAASLFVVQGGVNAKPAKDFAARFNIMISHMRNIDRTVDQLNAFGSLKLLFYFRNLESIFEASLSGTCGQPSHCMNFVRLCNLAFDNVHRMCPEEQKSLGIDTINMARKFLRTITNTVDGHVRKIIGGQASLAAMHSPSSVKERIAIQLQGQAPPPLPGFESEYKNSDRLNEIRHSKQMIAEICSSLREFDTVLVYDLEFCPKEFLIERLFASFRSLVRHTTVLDRGGIEQPSILLQRLGLLISAFQVVEQYIGIDINDMVKQVLLQEFCDSSVGGCGDSLLPDEKFEEKKEFTICIQAIANWYRKLFVANLAQYGMYYSQYAQGFVAREYQNARTGKMELFLHADRYTDMSELRALCTIVGPPGVRLIEKEMLSHVSLEAAKIKEILSRHATNLKDLKFVDANQLAQIYSTPNFAADLKACQTHAISIGCALQFRQLLLKALEEVVSSSVPMIYTLVRDAHQMYPPLFSHDPNLTPLDQMALDCGVELGLADQRLRAAFARHQVSARDQELWKLLPEMFACSFVTDEWRKNLYDISQQAFVSNVSCLGLALFSMMMCFQTQTLDINRDSLANAQHLVRGQLEKFIRFSSFTIMNYSSLPTLSNPDRNNDPRHELVIASILIFFDQFITTAQGLVSHNILENYMPYGTLHNAYAALSEKSINAHRRAQLAPQQNEEEKKE